MQTQQRLQSLDFFRGLTVAAMILVNNAGDWEHVYAPLLHAAWNGCTPTDLIFPFFLFIVGVSISFALKNYRRESTLHKEALKKALVRALKIFGLGLLLAWYGPNMFKWEGLTHLRIPGVLQRIALVYLLSVVLFLKQNNKSIFVSIFVALLGYWALMTLVPVPGLGQASLAPETNLGAWLDRIIFTRPHLYKHSITWDPEGLLGTLPALGTALIGVLIGQMLQNNKITPIQKVLRLCVAGIIMLLFGWLWGTVFPINKSLWTSAYVLYTGGWACLGFGFCYWLIDIKSWKKWAMPFVAYGTNAIAIYVASGWLGITFYWISWTEQGQSITLKGWLMEHVFSSMFSPFNASLAYAGMYVLIFGIVAVTLYTKRMFIKV